MIKGLIFDLDGTVVDSIDKDFAALREALAESGIRFSYQEYIEKVGAKGEEIIDSKLSGQEKENLPQKILESKEEKFKENVRAKGLNPVLGIESLLKQAKEYPLWTALATGSEKDKVEFIFNQVSLSQYFDVIVSSDGVDQGKPYPEIFLQAARELNLAPSECLVFEDAILGIQSAKEAGMKCVAITTSSPPDMLCEADLVIHSFKDFDLKRFLKKI